MTGTIIKLEILDSYLKQYGFQLTCYVPTQNKRLYKNICHGQPIFVALSLSFHFIGKVEQVTIGSSLTDMHPINPFEVLAADFECDGDVACLLNHRH
jgi:hypothetical protein